MLTGMVISSGCATLTGRRALDGEAVYPHLTAEEARVLTRLTEILLPTEQFNLPSSLHEVPTVANINDMAGDMSGQTRDLLAMALWAFERRPMASFRFSRFSRLDDEEALRYVQAMQAGTFFERGLITTLHTVVCVNYWRDSRTWPGLDYHGPVTGIWGVRRLGNAPLPNGSSATQPTA
ncbi:gluconate 2-dehydrogenase subunit 3 family protein [Alcanivorax sp. JB21]|nr:gluconate 2-dehydrogenase subunit 3 family protein [Alcanivorax limicola]